VLTILSVIVEGKFAHTVREIVQEALNVVVRWAVNGVLNISPYKAVCSHLPIEGE
jgi:hypothetical protein